MSDTPFPLGVYVGNPTGGDPTAEAAFEASYQQFSSLMGANPQFIDTYIDQTQNISDWVSNASFQAWSNAQSPDAKNMTPVIALPMTSTAAGALTPDQYYQNFAAGDYDSILQGMVKAWADEGFTTQYWRPGWEMNLNTMPSYAGDDAATQADWVAAFQHISTVLHAAGAADGVNVQVVWNPSITNYSNAEATTNLYPGNQYVDVIGADVYADLHPYGSDNDLYDWDKSGQTLNSSTPVFDTSLQQWASDPVNLEHYYTDPASTQWELDGSDGHSLSLQNLIDFAKAQGKPLAIGETGAGATGDGAGVSDNPTFVQWLYNTLQNSGVPIDFVNIWDSNGGGNYEFSNPSDDKPLEAAAWAQYFGAQPATSPTDPSAPSPITIGSGADTVTLQISEDAWQGDAQFTVSVDGTQVGGTQTATASQALGQTQTFNIEGNWGAGTHTVSVDFLNDAYGGPSEDRNLYVNGASYDGVAATGATLSLLNSGTQSVTVGTGAPAVTTVGSGADTIDLKMSEDAYLGNAQFTVSVDGTQIGGTLTAQASHSAGQDQDFLIDGNFGTGQHTVAIDFLNDLYGGSSTMDRNLYLDSATFDGTAQPGASLALLSSGTQSFVAGQPDMLTLDVSEDAYQGNAQFTVDVDGKQVGGTYTATASHAAGQSQAIEIAGNWGLGSHTISVDFLNDLYGGSPTSDRNLYVTGASYNGTAQPDASLALLSSGSQSFTAVSSTTYNEGSAGGAVTTLGNDTVQIGSGAVTINADGPSVNVIGGTGAMTFIADAGNDTITAGSGTSTITGGSGSLSFTAGSGNATITTGIGQEVIDIVNGKAGGSLTINGFASGTDVIHLEGYTGTGVSSETVTGGSTNILLTDNTTITLTGFAGGSSHPIFG